MALKVSSFKKSIDSKFPVSIRLQMARVVMSIENRSQRTLAIANLNQLEENYFADIPRDRVNDEILKIAKGKLAVNENQTLLQDNIPENLKEEAALVITLLQNKRDKSNLIELISNLEFTDDRIQNKNKLFRFFTNQMSTNPK